MNEEADIRAGGREEAEEVRGKVGKIGYNNEEVEEKEGDRGRGEGRVGAEGKERGGEEDGGMKGESED